MENSRKIVFKKGAYIYVEGDEDSDEVFIVEKGETELRTSSDKIRNFRPVIKPGELFGFTSSLCRRPRMESAVAGRDTMVLALRRAHFIEMLRQSPEIAMKIVSFFAEELRTYNEMLVSMEEEKPDLLTGERKLFELGRYHHEKGQHQYACHVLNTYLRNHPQGTAAGEARRLLSDLPGTGSGSLPGPAVDGIYEIYTDRQMIFSEHESAGSLYIIKEGKVKITKISHDQEVLLSVLGEGEIFGELGIVSNRPRNATAVSWGKTVLLPIKKETLPPVLRKSPGIIDKIFMAISQRIWFTYIRLESRLYARPATRIYVFLENKLLEDRISMKSTSPATMMFGIDELLRMTAVPPEKKDKTIDLLLSDPNLSFNFGQTVIENPAVLSTKAKFARSRDHLDADDEDEEQPKKLNHPVPETVEGLLPKSSDEAPSVEPAPADRSPGLCPGDLRVPSADIPFDLDV